MLILGVDFETTGLDTQKDSIIEVGAVLWDTQRKMPLQIYSDLMWHESIWKNATATKEHVEKIVKLNEEDLKEFEGIIPRMKCTTDHLLDSFICKS